MGSHAVEVVPVVLEKHPHADSLSIVHVYGFTCIVKSADWAGIDRAAYVPPDSLVPIDRPEFAFLAAGTSSRYAADCVKAPDGKYVRVTARRFRKVLSYGLLVPIPSIVSRETPSIGSDMAAELGVLHYNPPEPLGTGGEAAPGPPGIYAPKYDVKSFQRWQHLFVPGEGILVLEKIHGCSGRWVYTNGDVYCGSRTEWKRERPLSGGSLNLWWRAMREAPGFEDWLCDHPDHVVYGEIYGQVQNLKYGTKRDEVRVAVFDIMYDQEWLAAATAREIGMGLPWVPTVGTISFDAEWLMEMAEGPSLVPGADHFREGVVVKPVIERWSDEIGRVQAKVISPSYLERC